MTLKDLKKRKGMRGLKYIIAVILFGVIMVFFDQNNLIKRHNNAQSINEMENDIKQCKNNFKVNTMRLHMLQTNPHYIEKIAREKYLMKKPDEDIYVFEER